MGAVVLVKLILLVVVDAFFFVFFCLVGGLHVAKGLMGEIVVNFFKVKGLVEGCHHYGLYDR